MLPPDFKSDPNTNNFMLRVNKHGKIEAKEHKTFIQKALNYLGRYVCSAKIFTGYSYKTSEIWKAIKADKTLSEDDKNALITKAKMQLRADQKSMYMGGWRDRSVRQINNNEPLHIVHITHMAEAEAREKAIKEGVIKDQRTLPSDNEADGHGAVSRSRTSSSVESEDGSFEPYMPRSRSASSVTDIAMNALNRTQSDVSEISDVGNGLDNDYLDEVENAAVILNNRCAELSGWKLEEINIEEIRTILQEMADIKAGAEGILKNSSDALNALSKKNGADEEKYVKDIIASVDALKPTILAQIEGAIQNTCKEIDDELMFADLNEFAKRRQQIEIMSEVYVLLAQHQMPGNNSLVTMLLPKVVAKHEELQKREDAFKALNGEMSQILVAFKEYPALAEKWHNVLKARHVVNDRAIQAMQILQEIKFLQMMKGVSAEVNLQPALDSLSIYSRFGLFLTVIQGFEAANEEIQDFKARMDFLAANPAQKEEYGMFQAMYASMTDYQDLSACYSMYKKLEEFKGHGKLEQGILSRLQYLIGAYIEIAKKPAKETLSNISIELWTDLVQRSIIDLYLVSIVNPTKEQVALIKKVKAINSRGGWEAVKQANLSEALTKQLQDALKNTPRLVQQLHPSGKKP